jgi:hypothetical protein
MKSQALDGENMMQHIFKNCLYLLTIYFICSETGHSAAKKARLKVQFSLLRKLKYFAHIHKLQHKQILFDRR